MKWENEHLNVQGVHGIGLSKHILKTQKHLGS
jgi:hypothetical protein